MPNQSSNQLHKELVYRATPFILTSILLIMILPIKELSSIQNMNVGLIVISAILFIDGVLLIIEGFRNLPDAGSKVAKTGAIFFFIVGAGVLLFGGSIFTEYNPFENKTSIEIVTILSVILGITVLVQFTAIVPFAFFHKRNLAHLAKSWF